MIFFIFYYLSIYFIYNLIIKFWWFVIFKFFTFNYKLFTIKCKFNFNNFLFSFLFCPIMPILAKIIRLYHFYRYLILKDLFYWIFFFLESSIYYINHKFIGNFIIFLTFYLFPPLFLYSNKWITFKKSWRTTKIGLKESFLKIPITSNDMLSHKAQNIYLSDVQIQEFLLKLF